MKNNRKQLRKIESRIAQEEVRLKRKIKKAEVKTEKWQTYEHKGRPMFGKPATLGDMLW
jgi:hypothetical protein